jgi:transposase
MLDQNGADADAPSSTEGAPAESSAAADAPKANTSIIRLEINSVIGRYTRPPKNGSTPLVAPFSETPAWLPLVWEKEPDADPDKKAKFRLAEAKSAWRAFTRVLVLIQDRIRIAGNKAIVKMWINRELPLPALDPASTKKGKRLPPKEGERRPGGTIAYQTLIAEAPGGDAKQGQHVPKISSDVLAATSRRIDKLTATLWKRKIPTIPCISDRWPIYLRPQGWRFTGADGKQLAFTIDGTWWEVRLAIPRKPGRRGKPDSYVYSTLAKVLTGDPYRGDPNASPTPKAWIPSTLALQKGKDGKWYVLIGYKHPLREPKVTANNVMIVHCGLRIFALAHDLESSLSGQGSETFPGADLINARKSFRDRRRSIQGARQLRRPGRGHKYQALRAHLDHREHQWVESWLRRLTSVIIRKALKQRVDTIFFPTFKDIRKRTQNRSDLPNGVRLAVHQAPWFKFGVFLKEACAKHGIGFDTFTPYYHTQRCPLCGHVSKASADYGKRWRFQCTNEKCEYMRNLEQVAIQNAFLDLAAAGRITLPAGSSYDALLRKYDEVYRRRREEAEALRNQIDPTAEDRKR